MGHCLGGVYRCRYQDHAQQRTNFNVLVNFGILTIMCVIAAIANRVIDAERATSAFFFEAGSDPTRNNAVNAIVTLLYASTF